jgi:outer membrane lipoprotein SlyB
MTLKKNKHLIVAASIVALAACSTTHPDVIQRGEAQQMSQVLDATVLAVRPVTVDGSQSGVGAAAGGIVGAVAGSSVGGYRDAQVAGVLGAVAGAMLGNALERSGTREDAVELLLQLRNGERRAIVQARGSEQLQAGEAVVVVTTGGRSRVMRAPPVSAGKG